MSRTTVIHVNPGHESEWFEELHNSWGSAPAVWDMLHKKYFPFDREYVYMHKDNHMLWGLWKNNAIPKHHRMLLLLACDRWYIAKKDYKKAAEDIQLFLEEAESSLSGRVNHWPRIAEILESNPDAPGIGLWCTSVSRNPFDGEWNECDEEYEIIPKEDLYDIYAYLAIEPNERKE